MKIKINSIFRELKEFFVAITGGLTTRDSEISKLHNDIHLLKNDILLLEIANIELKEEIFYKDEKMIEKEILEGTRFKITNSKCIYQLLSSPKTHEFNEMSISYEDEDEEYKETLQIFHITENEWNALKQWELYQNDQAEEYDRLDEITNINFQKYNKETFEKDFQLKRCNTPDWLSSTESVNGNCFDSNADVNGTQCGAQAYHCWIFYISDLDCYGVAEEHYNVY
nr:hypothetical protein [Anaerobacillus isosaccharinicus]MBA5588928.1 hypothetical protein [Anaerobacillus isosaccharinicus]QOY37661.1 hypothetical protein AWH56_008805 [Anaerobacillus isosaccharinicus]